LPLSKNDSFNANIHFTCDKSNPFPHLIDLQSILKRVSDLIPPLFLKNNIAV
jgi:hypothetical protein